jgi:hypothetical protein
VRHRGPSWTEEDALVSDDGDGQEGLMLDLASGTNTIAVSGVGGWCFCV